MLESMIRLVVIAFAVTLVGIVALSLLAVILGDLLPLLLMIAVPMLLVYWYAAQSTRVATRTRRPMAARWGWNAQQSPLARWNRLVAEPQADYRTWVDESRRLAADIKKLVRQGDRASREALAEVPASAARLAQRVRELARSAEGIDRYLGSNALGAAGRQAADMQQRAQAAVDPFVREQYLAAAESLERQMQICAELNATRERLQAEVARILASLTSMRSRIMALQSGMAIGGTPLSQAADELAGLQTQVDNFQESVRQVLQQASHTTT